MSACWAAEEAVGAVVGEACPEGEAVRVVVWVVVWVPADAGAGTGMVLGDPLDSLCVPALPGAGAGIGVGAVGAVVVGELGSFPEKFRLRRRMPALGMATGPR
eukprot:CAMPEP_0173231262 /NCGR_PEP_ID=MMETSP1142-20121109/8286_2 /TAXON_ID=483371 /ORGANISM="non described non described, Strain CCMP2298" /LENGTH=102 /DNA_ID=CAMNT_0014160599 /DNA_START=79 /DNA_END=387 /DNA_ORIENTATION=-